jgi:hypothetical protein
MFKQYSQIISNRISGEASDFAEILGDSFEGNEEVDYRDYCIFKMAYEELPLGMMDIKIIHNARVTMPRMLFDMEYNCKFADDSAGFFKARDIQAATAQPPDGHNILLQGRPSRKYVFGIDPARTTDRFAVQIVELGTPNKLVYSWTCQNKPYKFATKKIRELLRQFPTTIAMAMDEGGGGLMVEELLQEDHLLEPGDKKLYRYDDDSDKAKDGARMLYMINFSSTNWIEEANSLLQKNIEDKVIMFPVQVNPPGYYKSKKHAEEADDALENVRDTKQELTAIEVTYTRTGKKHFDLMPATEKTAPGEAPRHKDRYSALLLANYIGSRFDRLNVDELEEKRKKYYSSDAIGGYIEEFE